VSFLFLKRILGRTRKPRVLLVTKAECPLCDDAKEALERARGKVAFELEVRSIEADEALREAHALEVPVLFIDGKKKFFGRVEPLLLARELSVASRRA
jgi:glutaredoxin